VLGRASRVLISRDDTGAIWVAGVTSVTATCTSSQVARSEITPTGDARSPLRPKAGATPRLAPPVSLTERPCNPVWADTPHL
jgi:hypothetical protein